jgi:hypothetical protein
LDNKPQKSIGFFSLNAFSTIFMDTFTQASLFQDTEIEQSYASHLSTNILSNSKRVQRWANFIAGYSLEFVENCIYELHPLFYSFSKAKIGSYSTNDLTLISESFNNSSVPIGLSKDALTFLYKIYSESNLHQIRHYSSAISSIEERLRDWGA